MMDFDQEFARDRWALSAAVMWIAFGRHGHSCSPGAYVPDSIITDGKREGDDASERRFRERDAGAEPNHKIMNDAAAELLATIERGGLEFFGSKGLLGSSVFEDADLFASPPTIDQIFNRQGTKRLCWGARFEPDWREGEGDTIEDGRTTYHRRLYVRAGRMRELWPPIVNEWLRVARQLFDEGRTDGKKAWKEAEGLGYKCSRKEFLRAWGEMPGAKKQGPKRPYANIPKPAG